MSDRTPRLDLVKQYLEDYSDERVRNINWDILDLLFHPTEGHTHDGTDSPLIDLESIWKAIEELRKLIEQLRIDHNNLDIREWIHFQTFRRHKHYSLNSPPSTATHWFESFQILDQLNMQLTNAAISTQNGILHLPANYKGNSPYYMVGKPFNLSHTQSELEKQGRLDHFDPDVHPDKANARIFMARKGFVTPYLAIGDNLTPNNNTSQKYSGAKAGTQKRVSFIDDNIISKMTFDGKTKDNMTVPHIAWHHIDLPRPAVNRYNERWTDREEFNNQEYSRMGRSDGAEVITSPKYQDSDPVYKTVNISETPRVLFNSDKALAWHEDTNKYYWYQARTNVLQQIPNVDIKPLVEDNMVSVAATLDQSTGWIWVLKSWNVRINNPAGKFDQMHQIVRWDGFTNFEEGKIWRSSRHNRKHWPAKTIAPTHLEVDKNNIYAITHLSFNDEISTKGQNTVNYYNSDSHDDYQWFPFRKVYGNLHKQRSTVNFVKFNPGILGSINSISKKGDWVARGSARIINGAFRPQANRWSIWDDSKINDFEGANDKVYLGSNGDELFFYQSFTPWDGSDIQNNQRWKNAEFRENHPDFSWHGIIAHNIGTGKNRFIKGTIPFRANTGGGIVETGGQVYLSGGAELVKQFVTNDERILSTVNNIKPQNQKIIFSYWIDSQIPGVKLPKKVSLRDEIVNPIKINLNNGNASEVPTHTNDRIAARTHNPQIITHSGGFDAIGGQYINNRQAIRLRKTDTKVRRVAGWSGALVEGSKARQLFSFELGEGLTERDIVKVHMKARSEGRAPTNPLASAPRIRDIDVLDWRYPEWGLTGRISNTDGHVVFPIVDLEWINQRKLIIMIENARITDKKAGIPSKLFVDYCYVTVERQGYVYEYEWEDLPQGSQAAMVLECQTGTKYVSNPGREIAVGSRQDILGVEVEEVDLQVISNNLNQRESND